MVVGAGFVAWSAWIHLHLWQIGYQTIQTIGWLFLFQAVTGFALALAVVILRRSVPALLAAGFLLATLGGLVWSVEWGLFGFQDSLSAPYAGLSMVVEITGAALLVVAGALRPISSRGGHRR